jgi:hypothetical protein
MLPIGLCTYPKALRLMLLILILPVLSHQYMRISTFLCDPQLHLRLLLV